MKFKISKKDMAGIIMEHYVLPEEPALMEEPEEDYGSYQEAKLVGGITLASIAKMVREKPDYDYYGKGSVAVRAKIDSLRLRAMDVIMKGMPEIDAILDPDNPGQPISEGVPAAEEPKAKENACQTESVGEIADDKREIRVTACIKSNISIDADAVNKAICDDLKRQMRVKKVSKADLVDTADEPTESEPETETTAEGAPVTEETAVADSAPDSDTPETTVSMPAAEETAPEKAPEAKMKPKHTGIPNRDRCLSEAEPHGKHTKQCHPVADSVDGASEQTADSDEEVPLTDEPASNEEAAAEDELPIAENDTDNVDALSSDEEAVSDAKPVPEADDTVDAEPETESAPDIKPDPDAESAPEAEDTVDDGPEPEAESAPDVEPAPDAETPSDCGMDPAPVTDVETDIVDDEPVDDDNASPEIPEADGKPADEEDLSL